MTSTMRQENLELPSLKSGLSPRWLSFAWTKEASSGRPEIQHRRLSKARYPEMATQSACYLRCCRHQYLDTTVAKMWQCTDTIYIWKE
jgi:hypothetical protein